VNGSRCRGSDPPDRATDTDEVSVAHPKLLGDTFMSIRELAESTWTGHGRVGQAPLASELGTAHSRREVGHGRALIGRIQMEFE
jgi:hypothetical protein